jgi:hypothetical protein
VKFLAGFLYGVLTAAVVAGASALALVASKPQQVAIPQPVEVVRMLDVTIKDSNTTNRRQRFECRPVERSKP